MSEASVCVLALNGRRQIVKCTPNTTILQILEEVCKKQNLKSDDYDLKHHNKILDTTTTFRFSGLPNNAQLELVAATKTRLQSEVMLAVSLENGNRLTGNFSPNDNLFNILSKIYPECLEQGKSPVVIYTRREIYGQELAIVTLKSLGLTGGRAMIRVINKNPEELKIQANVAVPLPSKPIEEKPYVRKFQPLEETLPNHQSPIVTRRDSGSESDRSDTPKVEKIQKKQNVDLIKLAREKRKNNETLTSHVKDERSVPEKQKKTSKLENCVCTKKEIDDHMDCFEKCKEECNMETDEIKDDIIFLGKRNALLFSPETASAVPSEDLPDDFFDLTIDDAKKLLKDVKKELHNIENSPLLTSNLRNLEESKKQLRSLSIYKKTIIRIKFPERVVLQGTFAPSDTIRDVIEFIRDYLENKSLRFYVYSTPPKCILEESKRLIELGFVPGALIHFGTYEQGSKYFLRKDLKDKFTSNSVASLAAAKIRRENTRKCNVMDEDVDTYEMTKVTPMVVVNEGASTSSGITHERKIPTPTENIPKWFKPL
ncbi:tether containing UBX domain for GLUT4 [Diorhabda sublineata]|uniref:tether containing UBX domain for GLUT4 n=1 Tax=Diorhabda sublineata TaxID=1163346 RepID=UPI0024E0BC1D|nr:tether containing UBX domain for GLUT4 [Diorhabda sublineata]